MKIFSFRPTRFISRRLLELLAVLSLGSTALVAGKGQLPGAELFTDDRVTQIEIEIGPGEMDALRQDSNYKSRDQRKGYSVTVREGTRVYRDVDLHLKGRPLGSFRPITDKPAFTLSFDKHVANQSFHGLKKISFNNSMEDPTRISERFVRELYRSAGVPAPRVGVATARLNGRDLGVYVLLEGYTRQFLKQHFPNPDGNLYDADPGEEINASGKQPVNSGRNREDQSRLKDLVAAAQEPDLARRMRRLEDVLDVERFVSMLAVDVMINNWDGYSIGLNNYRMFHDLKSNRIVFLPHGLDLTFNNPKASIVPRLSGLVGRALLETPEGRQRYLRRLAELTEKIFDAHTLTNRARQLAAPIAREMIARDAKLAAEHQSSVNEYCAHVAERAANLRQQLVGITQPLQFDSSGSAPLREWKPVNEFGVATFDGTNATDHALVIRADHGAVIGRWSKRVWLEKGRYRLEGKIRTTDVAAAPGTARGGAALRPANRHATDYAVGTQDWKTATFDFEVFDPFYEIELLCELRAQKGEAQFDGESLKLFRLSSP